MNTRIQQNASLQYLGSRPVNDAANTKSSAAGASSSPAAQDKLSLSSEADKLASLTQIAAASPDMDTQRVAALRDDIANGRYTVDADALASSMLTADRLIGR